MNHHYDIIIIGAGAAGLFTSIQAPKHLKKLILEKGKNPGVKVLLSGGERANVSNMDIEPQRDYFGQNKKSLISLFQQYNNYDIMSFFGENGVNIVEEDRGRLILESGDSKELLNVLLKKSRENNTQLECNQSVISLEKEKDIFIVTTSTGTKFFASKVVITTGGQSFSQVGTTGDGYVLAKNFGHTLKKPHRGLCGLVTKRDFSEISGVSLDIEMQIFDKNNLKRPFYREFGPLLFTHFGISGPIIFNTAVALGEHINSLKLDEFISHLDLGKVPENEKEDYIDRSYILKNIFIQLDFHNSTPPKRIQSFFGLDTEENNTQILELQDYRTWKEAKVTGGGINMDELTNHLESKYCKGLYFAGEILDLTGKTGGFNLQLAWTTGYVVGKNI